MLVTGEFGDDYYTKLDILLTPCNYLHTHSNYTGDSVSPECVPDLEEQIKYIGPS